jgi:hypothetical protein
MLLLAVLRLTVSHVTYGVTARAAGRRDRSTDSDAVISYSSGIDSDLILSSRHRDYDLKYPECSMWPRGLQWAAEGFANFLVKQDGGKDCAARTVRLNCCWK